MKNETMIERVIELLKNIDAKEVESVEVKTYKYDDETTSLDIEIQFLNER